MSLSLEAGIGMMWPQAASWQSVELEEAGADSTLEPAEGMQPC